MSESRPVFSRAITLGNVLSVASQLAGVLGILATISGYFSGLQRDIQDVKNKQEELVRWRDAREGEDAAWRRTVSESLDDYRHRLDRIDWVLNPRGPDPSIRRR